MTARIAAASSRSSTAATSCSAPGPGSAWSRWPTCWTGEGRSPATRRPNPLAPQPTHFPAKAKSVIWLFMEGAPERRRPVRPQAGADKKRRQADRDRRVQRQPRPADEVAVQVQAARPVRGLGLRQVPERREARRRDRVRQVAATPSRTTTSRRCTRSTPGIARPGFPSAGAWVTYGLGSENQNLPGFVVLGQQPGRQGRAAQLERRVPAGRPTRGRCSGPRAARSSTSRRPKDVDARRPAGAARPAGQAQRRAPARPRRASRTCSARIESFELAYRMQTEAADLVDLSKETAATRALYGLDDTETAVVRHEVPDWPAGWSSAACGSCRSTATASGTPTPTWPATTRGHCAATDLPIDGLLTDLKRRGLLDSTLVIWGGEFGRMPISQGNGRPRPQPARLPGLDGRRRHQGRARATARPTRSATRPPSTAVTRPRPARHDPAPAGPRPQTADLPPQRPPLPPDRRGRQGADEDPGVKLT